MKDVLLINKPAGWTSFDVVAKIRNELKKAYQAKGLTPTKRMLRVGHAGTLDPFATGLLTILIGEKCREATSFSLLDKTYEFTAQLGLTSTTGDIEGIKKPVSGKKPLKEEVELVLEHLTGEIEQIPPAYSAIKVDGKRAYKLAREGKEVKLEPRNVTIYELTLLDYTYPYLKGHCRVSTGTYIRSLVEDIGKLLKTGAYCTELRRTQVGEYKIENATAITDLSIIL